MTREEALAITAQKYMRLYREKNAGYEPSMDDCAICRLTGYPDFKEDCSEVCFAYKACCEFSRRIWGSPGVDGILKTFLWAARWCISQMEGTKYYAMEEE